MYLLKEQKFIETNKNIYKIGKSDKIYTRLNQYPNGSLVYLIIESNNITKHESALIRIFNNTIFQFLVKSRYRLTKPQINICALYIHQEK